MTSLSQVVGEARSALEQLWLSGPSEQSPAVMSARRALVDGLVTSLQAIEPAALIRAADRLGRAMALEGQSLDVALHLAWRSGFCIVGDPLAAGSVDAVQLAKAREEWSRIGATLIAALVDGYQRAREEYMAREREELMWLAVRDGLTGLYNQRFFKLRLEDELSRAERHGHVLSMLMLDADHFKLYNDTWGHLMGDEVLKGMAEAVNSATRRTDFVARYGGEEYVVVLPETSKEGAMVVAERIRQTVEALELHGMESQPLGRVTVSIGCATFPADAKTPIELIRAADTALYEAKRLGRNRTCAFVRPPVLSA